MKPVVLIIMDGWGVSDRDKGNAIKKSNTPVLDKLSKEYPSATISASGFDVGLPDGQMGNSEVGHLTIGSGRIIYQDLTKINKSIEDGEFYNNEKLLKCIKEVKENNKALHLMGLLSDGGVHSHNKHLYAILKTAKDNNLKNVFIHCFLDGRDTPPKSAKGYLVELENEIKNIGVGTVSTISGRFFAMDRDNRWDRVEKAYSAITKPSETKASSVASAIESSYEAAKTDEFVEPVFIEGGKVVEDGDRVLFFNFRGDRAREITSCFTSKDFDGFSIDKKPDIGSFYSMTSYDDKIDAEILFPQVGLKNILAELLSEKEIKQFRVAETEKYAHVTFFFNGGVDNPFLHEDRVLIPSDKDIDTYDERPEMKAADIAASAVEKIKTGDYGFILMNFANGDMVGHTGNYDAALVACEAVDSAVGRVVDAGVENGYTILITADHGNAEQMIETGSNEPFTAHTSNIVPLIFVDENRKEDSLSDGGLADIAPTILKVLGMEIPQEMTGKPLI